MSVYTYRAKDSTGKDLIGSVEAKDTRSAAQVLKAKGLFVYRLNESRQTSISAIIKRLKKPSLVDISTFTRQLSTMINAGLPLTESLTMLKEQGTPMMREILGGVLRDVEGGSTLANALSKYPKSFSPVYTAIVSAGESAGVLDQLLARLADNLEGQREFRAKVKGALIYPVIIVVGMVLVMFIMMIFVIPKLTTLYTEFDAELPVPTKIVMGLSSFSAKFWWLFLLIGAGGFWLYKIANQFPSVKRKIERFKLKIPLIGNLSMKVILAEITRTLGLLVGAGVTLLEALGTASRVSNNMLVEEAFIDVGKKVEKGYPLAAAVAETGLFPSIMAQMLSVGEETGKLDEVLMKVSKFFQSESEELLKGLTTAIEPLIMIVLGVGVGFLVIAVIMPIYSLTSQF